jgi:uncharacterized membrane-anchored protein
MKEIIALFIVVVAFSSFLFAGYVMGAIIGTALLVLLAAVTCVFLLWLAITSLWDAVSGSVKRLFKRKETK